MLMICDMKHNSNTDKTYSLKSNFNISIKILFLLFLFFYSVSFCFWSRGNNDIYYWLNMYSEPCNSMLTCGTYVVARWWCDVFGYNVLSVRILSFLCNFTALTLPALLYHKSTFFEWKNLIWYGLAVILMGYGTFNEFSPYSISFLLLSATISIILLCEHSIKNSIILGLLSALVTLCRFPNFVIFFIVFAYIITSVYKNNYSLRNVMLNLISYILSYMVLLTGFYLISGFNPLNIIESINYSKDETHTFSVLLERMGKHGFQIFSYCGIITLLFVLSTINIKETFFRVIIQILGCIGLLLTFYYNIGLREWANWNLHYFISALCICFVLLGAWMLYEKNHKISSLHIVLSTFVMFVPAIGSDVSFFKLFPNVLVFLPLVGYSVQKEYIFNMSTYAMLVMLILFSLLCYSKNNFSKCQPGDKKTFMKMCYYDDNPYVLQGVCISKSDRAYIDTLLSDYTVYSSSVNNKNLIFYGDWAHYAHEITNTSAMYHSNFFMDKNDSIQLKNVFDIVNLYDNIVLFDMRKNDSDYFLRKIEELDLIKQIEREYYTIYIKE